MNDWIGNIFYFGSPKDGFKVYPDLGAVSKVFDGYYTNTETDWILVARKSEDVTRYTYVKYGLLTSLTDGRTGSCFGLSIDFVNHYFTDLKVFRTEIFENILRAILSDGKLLETQESSGKVAFKSYDLRDVAPYLEEMSRKIREVIGDKKYSNYVRPAYEIPQANDGSVPGLHPDSSSSAINEYFRTYGAIKLSPKLPIETKSPSEKQQENRELLEKRVGDLTEQLGQKDRELLAVTQKLEKLQASVNAIASEFSPPRYTAQPYETVSSANNKRPYPPPPVRHPPDEDELSPWTRRILVIVGCIVVLAVLVFAVKTLLFSSEEVNPQRVDTPAIQPVSQPSRSVPSPEPLLFLRQNGRQMVVLNEAFFFQQVRGRTVYDESDFKEVLTSFLFQFSPEVRAFYKGDKDELWNEILRLNPTNKRILTDHLKRGPFKIEGNADQQWMLRQLLIFKVSP